MSPTVKLRSDHRRDYCRFEQLKHVGAWLRVYGKGIYPTRPREAANWREGDAICFTRTKDNITVLFCPRSPGKSLLLRSIIPKLVSKITVAGYSEPTTWKFDSPLGLSIDIPESLQTEDRRPN